MTHDLICWKCGHSLAVRTLPLSRRDDCPACRAELHVCRMCVEFDPTVADQCREPTADTVNQKDHANFCDHFRPKANAWQGEDVSQAEAARAELEKLFGK